MCVAPRRRQTAGRRDLCGLTLIEVLAGLGLLAILLLTVLPQLLVPPELDVELIARQVAADMGLARRFAIARRQRFTVTFSPSGGPYTSYTLTDAGGNVEPDFPKDLPVAVTVTGTEQIIFRPTGRTSAGATLTFAAGTAVAQVTVLAATARAQVSGP